MSAPSKGGDLEEVTTVPPSKQATFGLVDLKHSLITWEGWLGDYNFAFLCLPNIPFLRPKTKTPPPFFGLNTRLPIVLTVIMGLQHALAMLSGIVTPPLILGGAGDGNLNLSADYQTYMISASLIVCGIGSAIQITRFKLWNTGYYLGTGLISVVGTSFTIIPLAQSVVKNMYKTGFCPSSIASDGTVTNLPCPQGYGAILGTAAVCAFLEIGLSFLPPKVMKKIFPPIVTGTTVFLIGVSLITAGFQGWGGGAGPCIARPATGYFSVCPNLGAANAAPWGDPQWIGLGFLVFVTILLVEYFGSPFLKNCEVVVGLIVGIIVSAATGYLDIASINAAPSATFLWVKTFPLSVYGPAVIPLLIVYLVSMIEAVGDVTASCDVSRVEVDGPEFESRIQGGVLADGINSFISALCTNTPLATFAQNNGVISLTRCANRNAGYMTCVFLILMGIFSKIAAVFLATPDAVIGGMTTFLFSNVVVSGIRILAYMRWTRRERFIVSAAFSIGLGVNLVPNWFSYVFSYNGGNQTIQGLIDSLEVIVSTGFCISAIITIFLNLILPKDEDTEELAQELAQQELDTPELSEVVHVHES
ncbi:NCS2 family nucleobase:cation symporter-2 [Endogone sp. FLAS-F59071]|nr:NCS2 family nucleobase:cation symporter-2 [Endogone sp. FLAS-F59071]|eukprot:RUS15460.1 NCS2 family nucleobase:cation symporter-2 [Endogone sp. FLAS-F59071]